MTTISPRLPRLVVALVALVGTSCATLTGSSTAPTHRALVIGIDRYSIDADPTILEARGLRDLRGAVRDATTMADVLRARGYAVRTLTDEQATRAALLDAVDRHLVTPTRPGDDVVFFFAGHGSKLPTGDRREVDGQDETLVPVDATRGVPDLRDDTLRRRLRPILDRGGRLTVILDACYSGAATRGLPPERRTRSAAPPRFVASLIPTTEPTSLLERGDLEAGDTLILAAAQDHQEAHETDGPTPRGVFTEALLRALGSAAPDEDAATTLRRAATRMASRGWLQHPVLAGEPERLRDGLFAPPRTSPTSAGTSAHAVARVSVVDTLGGQLVHLDGGWSRGLREHDVLVAGDVRLQLVAVDPTRSLARRIEDDERGEIQSIQPGTTFRRVRLGVADEPDLRVWMPESTLSRDQLLAFDRRLAVLARRRGVTRLADPWDTPPTHVVRFDESIGWRLVERSGRAIDLGVDPDDAVWASVLDRLAPGARLFVQLPLPADTARHVELGAGSQHAAIARSATNMAHYQLVGRRIGDGLAYTWARPGVDASDPDAVLPPRTAERVLGDDPGRFGLELTEMAQRLSRIRFLFTVESAHDTTFPYRLVLRRFEDAGSAEAIGTTGVERPVVRVGETLGLALDATTDRPQLAPRYVYVVLIDGNGRRQLLFPHPRHGSVENRFPRPATEPDERSIIPLGPQPILRVREPTGLDTYLLLTLDQPLTDPLVLDEDGVRAPRGDDHPLARLLLLRHVGMRGDATSLPLDWSLDRTSVRIVGAGA